MEGVVAARRLRKSMIEPSVSSNKVSFGRLNISDAKITKKHISNEQESQSIFYNVKKRFITKAFVTLILLIVCISIKLLVGNEIKNNNIINNVITEYQKDYSKEEFLEGFENVTNNIYTNINYIFPDKLVEVVKSNYIISVKPAILNFTIKDIFKNNNEFNSVIIYDEPKNEEVEIYKETNELLDENNIVEENKETKEEKLDGVGGGFEELPTISSSVVFVSEEVDKIKSLGIKIDWPVQGTITSRYGERDEIFKEIGTFHTGLDIANKSNTEIKSATEGTVTKVETNKYYGKTIEIDSKGVIFKYAHLNDMLVKVGDKVNSGDLIAKMGSTGYSTGPHLHFEIRFNGTTVDPELLLE